VQLGDPDTTEQQRDALRYMMPGGQLAAQVDAQNMDAAAGLASKAIAGMVGNNANPMLPIQARVLEEEAAAKRRQNRQPDEQILADKYAKAQWRYLFGNPNLPIMPWGYDEFHPEEQHQMVKDLESRGYTNDEALTAVRRIASDRRATVRI